MKAPELFVNTPTFAKAMKKVVAAMKGYRWCLIGGRASEIWSNPPQTPDIDILAAIEDKDVGAMESAFGKQGVRLKDVWDDLGAPFIFLKDEKLDVEIDLFGVMERIHADAIGSAKQVTRKGVKFPVATLEFTIMLKAQAAADIGRPPEKRQHDRKAIVDLAKNNKVDKRFIAGYLMMNNGLQELLLLKKLGVI